VIGSTAVLQSLTFFFILFVWDDGKKDRMQRFATSLHATLYGLCAILAMLGGAGSLDWFYLPFIVFTVSGVMVGLFVVGRVF